MVRVVHELRVQHDRKDFIAVIVGGGPALASLKTLARKLNVADVIQFTGRIPIASVPAHIAAFDVCFTPDPSNAYNDSCTTIKTMEYMALRKPTVCFRTHENQVTAGAASLYADNNDIEAFARLVLQLMDDQALRESMGDVARQRIDNGLTWKHQATVLVALYRDLFGFPEDVSNGWARNGSNGAPEPKRVNGAVHKSLESAGHAESRIPELRFAFGGAVGGVLREHCMRDVQQSQLSAEFRVYYRLRPFIPLTIRKTLQRFRNRSIDVPSNWYLPTTFVSDLRDALNREPGGLAIHPWPDGHQMAVVLTHDIDSKDGMALAEQVAALEESFGFRSAWNIVPYDYKVDRGVLAELKTRGHEIGVHGYNHDGRLFESREMFESRTTPINCAIAEFGSVGFRAPMVHRNLEWSQALDIDYDASCFDVDPFQAMPGGVGGPWPFFAGKFVELPYTLPQDHTLLVSLGETTPRIWLDKLAYLRSLAGMAMMITHPDYLCTPSSIDIYRQFLEHLAAQSGCWHALPHQVASWWRDRDKLSIVGEGNMTAVSGPMARRARIFSLFELEAIGRHERSPPPPLRAFKSSRLIPRIGMRTSINIQRVPFSTRRQWFAPLPRRKDSNRSHTRPSTPIERLWHCS